MLSVFFVTYWLNMWPCQQNFTDKNLALPATTVVNARCWVLYRLYNGLGENWGPVIWCRDFAVIFTIFTKVCRVFYHFGRDFLPSLRIMFICLQIMCVKNCDLRCMFQKIARRQTWCIYACLSVKIRVFSVSGLKDEELIRKQTYTKTEAYKLYSRLFWMSLPNIIKIDRYNFELYRFKVGTFFWDTV